MPRKRQSGGLVPGRPGANYQNRSDLAAAPNLPARVATGQTYGKAQSQLQAQKAVPMAPPRLALPQGGPPSISPAQPGAPASPTGAPGVAPPFIAPGSMGDLHRPTERPNEPVTHGAALGPGAGPEAIPQGPTSPDMNSNLSALLSQIAQSSGSSAIQALAAHAQAAGQ